MLVKTRVFELCNGKYHNLSELAYAMGISVSQIYRVRQGRRNINQKFIVGVVKAFPGYKLDDLFYFTDEQAPHYFYHRPDEVSQRMRRGATETKKLRQLTLS